MRDLSRYLRGLWYLVSWPVGVAERAPRDAGGLDAVDLHQFLTVAVAATSSGWSATVLLSATASVWSALVIRAQLPTQHPYLPLSAWQLAASAPAVLVADSASATAPRNLIRSPCSSECSSGCAPIWVKVQATRLLWTDPLADPWLLRKSVGPTIFCLSRRPQISSGSGLDLDISGSG